MEASAHDEETESRFAHLLKPIKDLAENWDVDIAGELLEYIDELDKISIEFEDGNSSLNFAEAALLIQGSTTVYTKKVELLYKLVYDVLDMICGSNDARNLRREKGGDSRNDSKRARNAAAEYESEHFLSLDDAIQVGTDIDMKTLRPGDESLEETQGLRERVPYALLASKLTGGAGMGGFKLLTCNVERNGAIMLESSRSQIYSKDPAIANNMEEAKSLENDFEPDDDDEMHSHGDPDFNYVAAEEQGVADFGSPEAGKRKSIDLSHVKETPTRPPAFSEDETEEDIEELDGEDPWQRLDPHDAGPANEHVPIKTCETWRIPKRLQGKGSSTANHPTTYPTNMAQYVLQNDVLVSLAVDSSLASRIPTRESISLYPEFRSFAATRRKQIRERNILYTKKQRSLRDSSKLEGSEDKEEEIIAQLAMKATGAIDEDEFDLGAAHDEDFEERDNELYHGQDDQAGDERGIDDTEGDDNVAFNVNIDSAGFNSRPDTYMSMVKVHLQRYLETANKWSTESCIHSKVREWEEKIEPYLEAETMRCIFDIDKYTGNIIQQLHASKGCSLRPKNSKESMDFDNEEDDFAFEDLDHLDIPSHSISGLEVDEEDQQQRDKLTGNEPPLSSKEEDHSVHRGDVCRLFLATLQLANNGSVELVHSDQVEDHLRLRLLHPILDDKGPKFEKSIASTETETENLTSDTSRNKRPKRNTIIEKPPQVPRRRTRTRT